MNFLETVSSQKTLVRYKWANLDEARPRLTALGLTRGVLHVYPGRIKSGSPYLYIPSARTRGSGQVLNAASHVDSRPQRPLSLLSALSSFLLVSLGGGALCRGGGVRLGRGCSPGLLPGTWRSCSPAP